MNAVHKYELAVDRVDNDGLLRVAMPAGALALSVHSQVNPPGVMGEPLYVWAAVDTEAPMAIHGFVVVGTGHPLPALAVEGRGPFLGTAHLFSGRLVLHVWDAGELL